MVPDTVFGQIYQLDPPSTEIKPFHLHLQLNDDAYLCPVQALADWISVSEIKTGYLFCWMDVSDRVTEKPMTSDTFLEMFHNNLLDVNIDPSPYSTHSFCRRGGCQYFASHNLRWSLRTICEWGGWSTEFTNL
ncbi:hypothetical protein L208DRAFT_1337373, partial [Tricholoma matsutake]